MTTDHTIRHSELIGRTPREGARLCPHDEVTLDVWRADESGVWGSGYGVGLDEVVGIWENRYESDPRDLAREEA